MSDYLSQEIVQEILLRLPIDSVVRCCSVCKPWRSLIESSAFVNARLRRTIQSNNQNDTHLLLSSTYPFHHEEDSELLSLRDWDKPAIGEFANIMNPLFDISPCYFPATTFFKGFDLVGTCNGLICLNADSVIIIWNPCVRKFVCLPRPSLRIRGASSTYFFGYDSRANDYKVGRVLTSHFEPPQFEIWSLATGSWKSLSPDDILMDCSSSLPNCQGQISVNGVLLWYSFELSNKCILCFDMVSESFGKILLPDALITLGCTTILRYGESLALIEYYCERGATSLSLHIWVMKEFGVAESWTKLLVIDFRGSVSVPLGFRNTGQLVLVIRGTQDIEIPDDEGTENERVYEKFVSLDTNTREFKDLEIDVGCVCSYTESLVLLGQPNAISY